MDNNEFPTVIEFCPHCLNEVEIRWYTRTMGFKAFCPICGEPLLLCEECRKTKACDFDDDTSSCRYNKAAPLPPALMRVPVVLGVDTPLGTIAVRASVNPAHPGVRIELHRSDTLAELPLALIEFAADEGDLPENVPHIITHVWSDSQQEDYTDRVIHKGIEEFFRTEEDK